MSPPRSIPLCLAALFLGCTPRADTADTGEPTDLLLLSGERPLLLVDVDATEADARDLDFLAATAAAAALGRGMPALLGLEGEAGLHEPHVADFLGRYGPDLVVGLGIDATEMADASQQLQVSGDSGVDLAAALAEQVWAQAPTAVLVDPDDFDSALVGAALAARLRAPMLYSVDEDLLARLQTEEVLVVGGLEPELELDVVSLADSGAVIAWAEAAGLATEYLAAVNPADRDLNDGPKQSMLGPVLAARRDGLVVTLPDSQDPDDIQAALDGYQDDLGRHPTWLALMGSARAIPFARVDNPLGWEDTPELMTDAPYAQADEDPFLEIAIGRVVSDDLSDGSVLVSRTSTYELLQDGIWDASLVEAGRWGADELAPLLHNVGYETAVDGVGRHLSEFDRIEAAFLLHYDHSWWEALGEAYDVSTDTLLAPAVVISGGCSVAALDLTTAPFYESVVKHLLGQGAVAVLSAPRNAITQNSQLHTAFLNRVIEGHTLGEAYKQGFASLTLNTLDDPHDIASEHARYNNLLVGDPALRLTMPDSPVASWAAMEGAGDSWEALGPGDAFITPTPQALLDEWGWTEELHIIAAPGMDSHTRWGAGHDSQTLYYIAAVTSTTPITTVVQEEGVPEGLGWTGSFHVDAHQDGTSTAMWRVRFLELDEQAGALVQQVERIAYVVE